MHQHQSVQCMACRGKADTDEIIGLDGHPVDVVLIIMIIKHERWLQVLTLPCLSSTLVCKATSGSTLVCIRCDIEKSPKSSIPPLCPSGHTYV